MSLHIITHRTPRGRCHCGFVYYDTDADSVIGEHNRTCGQALHEREHPKRKELNDLLAPMDPDLEEHMRKEYKAGRLKPSTERIV